DEDDNPPVTNPNDPANQKCKVTKLTYTEPGYTGETVVEYNTAGRISKIIEKEGGIEEGFETLEYNGAGQVTKSAEDDGEYETFEYNGDGLLIKKNEFYRDSANAPLKLQYFYTYEYDANKKLTKRNEFRAEMPNTVSYYDVFTYPAANS